LEAGSLFTLAQAGQTMCSVSLMVSVYQGIDRISSWKKHGACRKK
jgi:hypothetical protein